MRLRREEMYLGRFLSVCVFLYSCSKTASAPSCLGPNELPLNPKSVVTNSQDSSQECECPKQQGGVYWREWDGHSPDDVIIGGHFVTDCGLKVPLFLAKAYHQNRAHAGVQPAQLLNNTILMTATYQVVYQIRKNIKVLCGDQDAVAWLPYTQVSKLSPLTDFVRAGFEPMNYVYFGRGFDNGKRVIGKVVLNKRAMYFPYWGHPKRRTVTITDFDILCYRESLVANNISIPSRQLD